jgi:hypothetical protein
MKPRLAALPVALCVMSGCGGHASFAKLERIAASVPVPAGVTLVGQRVATSVDATKGASYRQVTLSFRTNLSCTALQGTWLKLLQHDHRRYEVQDEIVPGHHQIVITDSGERAAINLNGYPTYCSEFDLIVAEG